MYEKTKINEKIGWEKPPFKNSAIFFSAKVIFSMDAVSEQEKNVGLCFGLGFGLGLGQSTVG